MKYTLKLWGMACGMFLLMPFAKANEPTILEMRVMQSRIYEIAATEFLAGMKEACKSRGGHFYGDPKLFDRQGVFQCSDYDTASLNNRGFMRTSFRLEGVNLADNKIQVRIYAQSFAHDGPRGMKIVKHADPKVYELLFKDISDAVGLKDIPIQVNRAE